VKVRFMVFSSYIFLFYFLPGALLSYHLAPRKFRNGLLTLISYLFYGWSNQFFCFLMFFSTLVDYVCGRILQSSGPEKKKRRLGVLWVSQCGSLRARATGERFLSCQVSKKAFTRCSQLLRSTSKSCMRQVLQFHFS